MVRAELFLKFRHIVFIWGIVYDSSEMTWRIIYQSQVPLAEKKVSQLFSQLTMKELQENKLMITNNLDILFFKPLAVRTTEKTFINATLMVV